MIGGGGRVRRRGVIGGGSPRPIVGCPVPRRVVVFPGPSGGGSLISVPFYFSHPWVPRSQHADLPTYPRQSARRPRRGLQIVDGGDHRCAISGYFLIGPRQICCKQDGFGFGSAQCLWQMGRKGRRQYLKNMPGCRAPPNNCPACPCPGGPDHTRAVGVHFGRGDVGYTGNRRLFQPCGSPF